jgi:hypothetical protein
MVCMRMTSVKALPISCCAAVLLAIFAGPHASFAQDVPRITFPPMTQDDVDRFRDSLKNNVALVSHSPRQSERVDSHTEGVWAGSQTDVQTNIEEVVLRFRPSTEEVLARSITTQNESKALLEYVDLKLSYKFPQVTFIHSHPQDGREVSGFEAKVIRKDISTRVKMIAGQRESTMYVAVPPFNNPAELWGLYICPRIFKYQSVGRTGTRVMSFGPSPYSLSEVRLSASAVARASFEASRGKVRAAVSLQLSRDMPESVDSSDLSISAVAEPKVTYRPKFPFDFFRFAPQTDIQQGLNMVVELQNRAGKIRRQNFSHVLSVHKSNEPSPVSVMAEGVRPASDTGDCYLVQVQKYSWKEFSAGEVNF